MKLHLHQRVKEAIITGRSRSTRFSDEPRSGLRGFGDLFVPKRSLCASEYFTRTPSRVAVPPRSAARSSLLAVCSFVGLISRLYMFVYEYIAPSMFTTSQNITRYLTYSRTWKYGIYNLFSDVIATTFEQITEAKRIFLLQLFFLFFQHNYLL